MVLFINSYNCNILRRVLIMKKRLLAIILCATMAFSFCACGDSNSDDTEKNNDSQSQDVKQPTIKELADYSDMSVVLSGKYAITDDVIKVYFSNVLYFKDGLYVPSLNSPETLGISIFIPG